MARRVIILLLRHPGSQSLKTSYNPGELGADCGPPLMLFLLISLLSLETGWRANMKVLLIGKELSSLTSQLEYSQFESA
jgi:hypothetical protein